MKVRSISQVSQLCGSTEKCYWWMAHSWKCTTQYALGHYSSCKHGRPHESYFWRKPSEMYHHTNVVYKLNETKVHQLNLMLSGGTFSITNDRLHQNDSVIRLLFVQQIALIMKVRWEGLYYCIPCPVNLCWVSCNCGPFSSRNKQCANVT